VPIESRIDSGATRDSPAQRGQPLNQIEVLGIAEAASARHNNIRVGDVDRVGGFVDGLKQFNAGAPGRVGYLDLDDLAVRFVATHGGLHHLVANRCHLRTIALGANDGHEVAAERGAGLKEKARAVFDVEARAIGREAAAI
jgi:hypothetical protein